METKRRVLSLLRVVSIAFERHAWLHWVVVFAIPMAFFLVDKLVALSAILDLYATSAERTVGNKLSGVLLGLLEDWIVTGLLVLSLLVVEVVALLLSREVLARVSSEPKRSALKFSGRALQFWVVFALVALTLAPFAADMLLIRIRQMRFTMDLIATYSREKDQASTLEVEPREIRLAVATSVGAVFVALVFAGIYICWIDLLRCFSPRHGVMDPAGFASGSFAPINSTIDLEKAHGANTDALSATDLSPQSHQGPAGASAAVPSYLTRLPHRIRVGVVCLAVFIAYIILIVVTKSITHAVSPLVAAIALNASLNELFRNWFHVQFQRGAGSGAIDSAAYYLQSDTETYKLFDDDVLYRKTTGFKGPLAFDVEVDEKNPPNVLVLAVESFRYMDSLYMAENTTAGELMQKNNLTVTPQFDRWAKRGIAFNNMWSSWQTSRSLEAILFGQIAYDSVTDSGTTHGKKDTKLVGMPQMFKQKGYETVFTTGCITTYDQWDIFLPSHGFDTVIAAPDMKKIAEESYNISKDDWNGPAKRGFNWGVHDDVSFEILGDMMIKKVKEQAERVKRGEKKQPFFLNHYTISSHHTFDAHPTWLDSEKLPDFTPLCEGWETQCELIKKYSKLRYFTDMELGKFLDKMESAGVLKDTIVVIVGDHGQSPEMGLANPILYQTAVTHVASTMIAEGRLGKYAGMVYNDATHHYDLLNTLADIVGAPKEGFLQTGVGRSLKRQLPYGERLVYSNNPMKKMSIVRGHERFVYDRTSNDMRLFDTIKDPLEKNDLLQSQGNTEKASWLTKRRTGRQLNVYFKRRWENKCLTKVDC